jgi:predicted acyltransferase
MTTTITKPDRLMSLDVLRGLTIALMIMVNTPGSWSYIYWPLAHAPWHGWTPTDLVFPFFLFIVGTAVWFAFKPYNHKLSPETTKKIIRRTFLIFAIGLALNAFPYLGYNFEKLRIFGVLQRIALAYGIGSIICLSLKRKPLMIAGGAILLIYWGILWFFGGNDPYSLTNNFARTVDLAILGKNHMYSGEGIPFDPEGIFSTLPAIVTVIFGFLIGQIVGTSQNKTKLIKQLLLIGISAVIIGQFWHFIFPINKKLWTSSFVVLTGGLATSFLALFIWFIDVKGYKKWAHPFIVFGMNPLFIFVFSGLIAKIFGSMLHITYLAGKPLLVIFYSGFRKYVSLSSVHGDFSSFSGWLYHAFYQPVMGNYLGSFAYSVTFILSYWLIVLYMYRRKIFIKI